MKIAPHGSQEAREIPTGAVGGRGPVVVDHGTADSQEVKKFRDRRGSGHIDHETAQRLARETLEHHNESFDDKLLKTQVRPPQRESVLTCSMMRVSRVDDSPMSSLSSSAVFFLSFTHEKLSSWTT